MPNPIMDENQIECSELAVLFMLERAGGHTNIDTSRNILRHMAGI